MTPGAWLLVAHLVLALPAGAQADSLVSAPGDSVAIRLVDVDLRAAVQAMARYLDRPVIIGVLAPARVTLETPRRVARGDVVRLLRGLLDSQAMELLADSASGVYRVRPREPAPVVTPTAGAGTGILQTGPELFAIHLRHAKANEVAATVNALYGRASAFGEAPERPLASLTRDIGQVQSAASAASAEPQAVRGVTGRGATLGGETTIVPDARGNSLLVRASRTDFALIQAAVAELDIRPLQVLIEVMIVEVRRDRSLDFGVEATLPPTVVNGKTSTIGASSTGGSLGDFVLRVMHLGGVQVEAVLRAAASRGDVNILSRPVLLAANNERAEINVGSQRPFVQVSRVLPTENTARDQVVQYKDVGTRLQVVPTISADGYVMLQLSQEVNAATSEVQFDAPVISTRSVETRLLVRDSQTIVIGGLMDRQREVSQSGIPVLSSIPWIGGFFGRASRRSSETELFLFLTPRVIRSDDEADAATHGYELRARVVTP